MSNKDLDELSKLLEERDNKHDAEEVEKQRRREAMQQKALDFDEIKLDMILPVMEEVGEFLKSKKHDYLIKGRERFSTSPGYSNKQSINFQVRLRDQNGNLPYEHALPTLEFFVLIMDENPNFMISEENTDGKPSSAKTITVDRAKLNEPGFIRGRILDFTKRVIGNNG